MARALALATLLALLVGFQCAGTCAASGCYRAQPTSGGCPYHQDSHEKQVACQHQHAEFAVPESVNVKHVIAQVNSPLPIFACYSAVSMAFKNRWTFNSGSPPPISALRI